MIWKPEHPRRVSPVVRAAIADDSRRADAELVRVPDPLQRREPAFARIIRRNAPRFFQGIDTARTEYGNPCLRTP